MVSRYRKWRKPFYEEPHAKDLITRTDYVTAKNVLDAKGADALVEWIKGQENLLLTDTTFRDAHQSASNSCSDKGFQADCTFDWRRSS